MKKPLDCTVLTKMEKKIFKLRFFDLFKFLQTLLKCGVLVNSNRQNMGFIIVLNYIIAHSLLLKDLTFIFRLPSMNSWH